MSDNQLPVDLDDCEMWLPSDISLSEIGVFNARRRELNRHLSSVDVGSLSNHLSASSLVPLKPKLPKQPMGFEGFQRFKSPAYCSSNPPLFDDAFGMNAGDFEINRRVFRRTSDPIFGFTEPLCEFHLAKPSQTQVESYLLQLARARVLQRHQSPLQNPVLPFQRTRIGSRADGSVKGACGTGVFHPRNVHYSIPRGPAGTSTAGSIRKNGSRNWQANKIQVTQQRTSIRRQADVNLQKDDCYYHLPPDMGFTK